MAWIDPKLDWNESYEPSPNDFVRIEGNIKHLRDEAAEFNGAKTFNDEVTFEDTATFNADVNAQGLTLSEDLKPTNTTTTSSIALGALSNVVLDRGVHFVHAQGSGITSSGDLRLEVYIDGDGGFAWRSIARNPSLGANDEIDPTLVFSDGSNVRVRNLHASLSATIYLRTF